MKLRKEMGEEKKKKEKTKAKESNTSLKNMLLKKKKKQLHSIRSLWRLLGFGWSCWVSDAPTGQLLIFECKGINEKRNERRKVKNQ